MWYRLTEVHMAAKDLIEHLLCIDPGKRFSIDQFLVHPWCTAAPAPPTPCTNKVAYPLDSPLLAAVRRGCAEGRSPGIATLKEAFDITYAVRRMEEEGTWWRKYNGAAGGKRYLSELNEDDEEEESERGREVTTIRGKATPIHLDGDGGRAGQRDRVLVTGKGNGGRGQGKDFELDLHGATLLGRRNKRGVRSPLGGETPLVMATSGLKIADGP